MSAQFDTYPEERRRSPRIDGSGIKVEYFPEKHTESIIKTTAKNICGQGICVFMPEIIGLEETIHMKILLPGNETPLVTKGVIVWYSSGGKADTFQAGIEFEGMSAADQRILSDFLNTRLR
ncbi:MAG TPA: PilZ domain-containing protein [Candidatus Omnitrophota bacterium]|nr:PilZ domain-containing protein [Candidatus Omnitrophota bacterium]